jgi:hypothetical protein
MVDFIAVSPFSYGGWVTVFATCRGASVLFRWQNQRLPGKIPDNVHTLSGSELIEVGWATDAAVEDMGLKLLASWCWLCDIWIA